MTWSMAIERNHKLSSLYLETTLSDFGFDEDEVENIAQKIINAVNLALPENISWLPEFAELWIWGDSVAELRNTECSFGMEEFTQIFDVIFEQSVY